MKNLVIVGVIVLIAAIAILPSLKDSSLDVDALLLKAKEENKLVLLELSSATCSTCKRMQPYLQQIEEEYGDQVVIQIIDVAARTSIAKQFKVGAIPTQVFFDTSGNEYFKHVGYMSKSDILATLQQKGLK